MTLKQMIARVMRALPMSAPGQLGETDIIDLLNEAQRELAVRSNKYCIQETALEADYDTVALPDDLLKLVEVYWGDGGTKRELYPEKERYPLTDTVEEGEGESEYSVGYPSKYYVKDRRIIIRPIPTTDNTVYVLYVNRPTDMVEDDDEPELDGSEEYLIACALQRIHLEAGSEMARVWEAEKLKHFVIWRDSSDQNYETAFKVDGSW